MIKRIHHVAIAVRDIQAGIESFQKYFNPAAVYRERVVEQGVDVALLKFGDVYLELIAPIDENSTVAKFLNKRGEGLHHIAFESDDIEQDIQFLKEEGLTLIDEHPRVGAHNMLVAFLHPKSIHGTLVELCQEQTKSRIITEERSSA